MKQITKKCRRCSAPAFSRNLCKLCYAWASRNKVLDDYPRVLTPVSIETRVKKTATCWLWTGDKTSWGYGCITTGRGITRRRTQAHRYVYSLLVGPIPKGKCVLHKCDNPPCVNPKHLILGTIGDNNKDTAIKRRHNFGLEHWNGRLSDRQIAAIRESTKSQPFLAKKYGVDQSHISRIKSGEARTWHTKKSDYRMSKK